LIRAQFCRSGASNESEARQISWEMFAFDIFVWTTAFIIQIKCICSGFSSAIKLRFKNNNSPVLTNNAFRHYAGRHFDKTDAQNGKKS